MSVINKPKKVRKKQLIILMRGIEKVVLENEDRENTVYTRLIDLMRRVRDEVLSTSEAHWSIAQGDAWTAFEAVEDAFIAEPTEGELDTLADDLETALDAI